MSPTAHAAISLSVGAIVWGTTKSTGAIPAALLTGVFLDLDHLPDYYRWLVMDKTDKLWLFLHGYEILIPALVASYLLSWNAIALSGTLGILAHLLADQAVNPVKPLGYFLTYRAIKRFHTSDIAKWTAKQMYMDINSLPLVHLVFPQLLLLIRRGKPLPW